MCRVALELSEAKCGTAASSTARFSRRRKRPRSSRRRRPYPRTVDPTGPYQTVLAGPSRPYTGTFWKLLDPTRAYWTPGSTRHYQTLPDIARQYQTLPFPTDPIGPYQARPGPTRPYVNLLDPSRPTDLPDPPDPTRGLLGGPPGDPPEEPLGDTWVTNSINPPLRIHVRSLNCQGLVGRISR